MPHSLLQIIRIAFLMLMIASSPALNYAHESASLVPEAHHTLRSILVDNLLKLSQWRATFGKGMINAATIEISAIKKIAEYLHNNPLPLPLRVILDTDLSNPWHVTGWVGTALLGIYITHWYLRRLVRISTQEAFLRLLTRKKLPEKSPTQNQSQHTAGAA